MLGREEIVKSASTNSNALAIAAILFGIMGVLLAYLLSDREDMYSKFYAVLSLLIHLISSVIVLVLFIAIIPFMLIPGLGSVLVVVYLISILPIGALSLALTIYMAVNAYNIELVEIPYLTNWSIKILSKLQPAE